MSKIVPMVYVVCLSAYNNGIIHGEWIEIGDDVEDLQQTILKVLAKSPMPDAEEWAFHDYALGGVNISESENLNDLVELAQFVREHQELGVALLKYTHNNISVSKSLFEDCYCGEYENEEHFVIDFIQETVEVPEILQGYIDYEYMAKDWFGGDYFSLKVNSKIHVFRND